MRKKIAIVFFLALFYAASAVQAQQTSTCQPGQVVDLQHGQFHLVFFAVWSKGLELKNIIGGDKLVGDYAIALHKAAKAGKVERYTGVGTLSIYIKNIDEAKMPSELAYLSGPQICRGMAKVEKVDGGIYKVTIPISPGENLAQASLVIPKTIITKSTVVCVKPSVVLAHAPEIIGGSFKGWPNTLCGLPDINTPGTTRLGEQVAAGAKSGIIPLIVME